MTKKLWIAAMSTIMAVAVWAPSQASATEALALCRAAGSICSNGTQCCSLICECGEAACFCE